MEDRSVHVPSQSTDKIEDTIPKCHSSDCVGMDEWRKKNEGKIIVEDLVDGHRYMVDKKALLDSGCSLVVLKNIKMKGV